MEINLIVAGATGEREAVEHGLKSALERAFESDAGELNVVLAAKAEGYVLFFARAVLEHAAGFDYSDEVRAALEEAGVTVVGPASAPVPPRPR